MYICMYLDRTGSDRIGPDWITDRITEKKVLKEKKIQKNQIVYELVITRK